MKAVAAFLLASVVGQPVLAGSQTHVFRTVAFICPAGPDGTAVRTVENILGERILYRITYFDAEPTLFVVLRAQNGIRFRPLESIDLRSETRKKHLEIARDLAIEMDVDAARYCQGGQSQIDARFELTANHEFNRTNARYRGK